MSTEQFYIASREPGQAHAAIVADGDDKSVKRFFRDHAGANITKVGRDDMERMLRAYIKARRKPSDDTE